MNRTVWIILAIVAAVGITLTAGLGWGLAALAGLVVIGVLYDRAGWLR